MHLREDLYHTGCWIVKRNHEGRFWLGSGTALFVPHTATEARKHDALQNFDSHTKPPIGIGGKRVADAICSQLSFLDVSKV